MSYQKKQMSKVFDYEKAIREQTLKEFDLTRALSSLELILELKDSVELKESSLVGYFDEINSDMLSVLQASLSGNYRLAICGLRGVLELACHAFYFIDHPIEYKMYIENDEKADRYVSHLISNDFFYKSKYISAIDSGTLLAEKRKDVFSDFLAKEYRDLCEHVHGKYKHLTKRDGAVIKFEKAKYVQFEKHFNNVASLIAFMFEVRFSGNIKIKKYISESAYLKQIIKEVA